MTGKIMDEEGKPIPFASVLIEETTFMAFSNEDGEFKVKKLPYATYWISIKAMGYKPLTEKITFKSNSINQVHFNLKQDIKSLGEVVIKGKSESSRLKEEAYGIEVLDAKNLQSLNIDMNQISNRIAGIRVRESGGLGSKFTYSLNGMSGRSIRFLVDGIPMDRLGTAYSINNFPINMIDRLAFYKGVVPPEFGSDALGGVVNIITKTSYESFVDASYSLGSFNTHRAALSSRWVSSDKKWYIDAQGFYNYSDNDYKVWGQGVEVSDPETGRVVEIKTKRFHDSYVSYSGRMEMGLQNQTWVDLLKFNFLYAGNDNEIQHGATMPEVYGEATREESTFSPSLYYRKQDILFQNLDFTGFSSISTLKSITSDTSSRRYNWLGEVIDTQATNSEMGSGRNGKSLLSLHSTSQFHQGNLKYSFSQNQYFNLNYTFDRVSRSGEDPMESTRTASFVAAQKISKQVASLAYGIELPDQNLENMVWLKYYGFNGSSVAEKYVNDSLGFKLVTTPVHSFANQLGYGLAMKYQINNKHLLKFSAEKSIRIPDADELLGDGLFVSVNPNLKPESSLNANVSLLLKELQIYKYGSFSLEPSLFWRDVSNLIQYRVQENLGTGQFQNIEKVLGVGASLDAKYEQGEWLYIRANATYQKMRDGKEFVDGSENLAYKDLLPNTPYFMANGGLTVQKNDWISLNSNFSFHWDIQYVHEFYLRWPSLGNSNKATIPDQLINSAGISYGIKSGKYSVSFSCNNLFDEQVYDNYLLQKPGRSFSLKFRTFIQKK
ncbi:TonB-dependent receptor [Cyclobacterium marinum]|uniref:TonB-dependent receptor n=1 Tax=Cyclobacterium marinum TaxID=104 RepID=UPI0030DB13C2